SSARTARTRTERRLRLARRADQAVVAPGADLIRRAGLEVLALDARSDLEHRPLHPFRVVGRGRHRDPLVLEDVPVAAQARLHLPGLARAEAIERELDVPVAAGPPLAGLVVDQLLAA